LEFFQLGLFDSRFRVSSKHSGTLGTNRTVNRFVLSLVAKEALRTQRSIEEHDVGPIR